MGRDVIAEAADDGGGNKEEAYEIESRWLAARNYRAIDSSTNRLLSLVAFKGGRGGAATTIGCCDDDDAVPVRHTSVRATAVNAAGKCDQKQMWHLQTISYGTRTRPRSSKINFFSHVMARSRPRSRPILWPVPAKTRNETPSFQKNRGSDGRSLDEAMKLEM